MSKEVTIASISDFELLIEMKTKKMNAQAAKSIKLLMMESFRVGAEIARNRTSKIKT